MKKWLPVRYHFQDRSHGSHEGTADVDSDDLIALMSHVGPRFVDLFLVLDERMAMRLNRYGPEMFQIGVFDEMTSQRLEGYLTNADAETLLVDLVSFGFDEDRFGELSKWGGQYLWDTSWADYWILRWCAEGLDQKTITKRIRARGFHERRPPR